MKKFLTVLLVIAVMFTFSFGTAMAVTADEALAQALASAKTSAVQSLNNFVNLSDYDADGQAEVKEIIEEGTMLINLQTEVSGVTTILANYQSKILKVDNANANAVAAAKKAAKESIKDYVDVLLATKCYASDAFDKILADYTAKDAKIDQQQVVIGVELMRDLAYGEIEKVEFGETVATDAEEAKALAEAKLAAINIVKGLEGAGKWATISTDDATADQIAAYKAKVNEVVAAIKAAKSEGAIDTILAREAAEVADLAAATEVASAQNAVKKALYNWAHGLDYTAYDDADYATIKTMTEKVSFGSSSKKLKIDNVEVTDEDGKVVVVDEMKDVEGAVEAAKAFILEAVTASVTADAAAAELKKEMGKINVLVDDTVVTQEMFLAAVRDLETAKTQSEVTAKKNATIAAWYAEAKKVDDAYAAALEGAQNYVAAYKKAMEASNSGWLSGAATAAKELCELFLAEVQADRNYPNGYKSVISTYEDVLDDLAGSGYNGLTKTSSYDDILAEEQAHLVNVLAKFDPAQQVADKDYDALKAKVVKAINDATTLTGAYDAFNTAYAALEAYTQAEDNTALAKRFAAFKAAEAAVLALPAVDSITLGDKAAFDAAYETYSYNKSIYVDAYLEAYGTATDKFVGEDKADKKMEDLETQLGVLATKLANFKDFAYANYLNPTAYAKYTAEQQAALTSAYNAGVAAISAAADTGYADDVDYVIEDAKADMADVVTKAAAKNLATLIADAKAFLGTTYDPADYSEEGLAKIAEIIATLDKAEGGKDVATLTIAARKAIAAVEETLIEANAAKINAVQSLKLKASSKAGKGYITVTWKVTGDAEKADGYQLYKSTKAQKGYKKCITTKKTSFKNTKNLKKGTRYFYKVRAYVTVDGTKYYSDWSNKANRYAK